MAITSSNLGLVLWNLPTDPYNSGQLADNFARIDEHDHSNNKGLQIGTAGIQDAAITADKLAPGAVPAPPSLQPVGSSLILDGAVTNAKLAAGAVVLSTLPIFPYSRVTRSTNQAIGTSTSGVKVTFTTMVSDTNSMWSAGTPTKLTCQTTGMYSITTQGVFAYPGFFEMGRMIAIQVNGVDVSKQAMTALQTSNTSILPALSCSVQLRLNSTDIIEVRVWSDSSTNLASAGLDVAYLSS